MSHSTLTTAHLVKKTRILAVMAPADLEDLLADNLTPHVMKTSTQNVKDTRLKELILKLIQYFTCMIIHGRSS